MATKSSQAFPYLAVGSICVGMLAHSIIFTVPLPFIAFMVVDFKLAPDVDSAGYYAGWICSALMVGRVTSSIMWGIASDKFGRKACILFSMANVCVLTVLFGFSINFAMALSVRFLIGLGNGFMGIAKTSLSELCTSKEHEIRAFGFLNGVWGLGYIVGPIIGGFFSRPALQYPSIFSQESLFGQYPYLLPCLCSAGIALLAFVFILFFMPETLTMKESKQSAGDVEAGKSVEMVVADGSTADKGAVSDVEFQPLRADDFDEETEEAAGAVDPASVSSSVTIWQLLCSGHHQLLLGLGLFFSLANVFIDETFPLWCVSSLQYGGLSWESKDIGVVMSVVGVLLIAFQIFLYEPMMKRFFALDDSEVFFRLVLLGSVPLLLMPYVATTFLELFDISTAATARHHLSLQILLVTCMFLYSYFVGNAFSAFTMIVNASVTQSQRGTFNGLMATTGSVGNFAGPISGSMLYAVLLQYGATHSSSSGSVAFLNRLVAVDGRLIFIIGAALAIGVATIAKVYLAPAKN